MVQPVETPAIEAITKASPKPVLEASPKAVLGIHDYDAPIRETLAAIRCYTMLRFFALPFFFLAFAVLTAAFYDYTAIPRGLVVQAGIALSLIVGIFAIVLSRHLIVLWHSLDTVFIEAPQWRVTRAHRHNGTLWTLRWILFAPYPIALVFWLDQLMYYLLFLLRLENDWLRYGLAFGLALLAGALMLHVAWRVWTAAEHYDHEITY